MRKGGYIENVRVWSTDGLDKSKGYASNDEKVKSHTAKNRDYLPLTNSSQRGMQNITKMIVLKPHYHKSLQKQQYKNNYEITIITRI